MVGIFCDGPRGGDRDSCNMRGPFSALPKGRQTLPFGTVLALFASMAIRKLEDMAAFQLALDFKLRVDKLVREHPLAQRDLRYRDQLFDAASGVESNIAEGWRRFAAREMCQFLRYGMASLEEAKRRVRDGIHRGHFSAEACAELLNVGDRCGAATMALWKSLQPFTQRLKGPEGPKDQRSKGPLEGPQGPKDQRSKGPLEGPQGPKDQESKGPQPKLPAAKKRRTP